MSSRVAEMPSTWGSQVPRRVDCSVGPSTSQLVVCEATSRVRGPRSWAQRHACDATGISALALGMRSMPDRMDRSRLSPVRIPGGAVVDPPPGSRPAFLPRQSPALCPIVWSVRVQLAGAPIVLHTPLEEVARLGGISVG